MIDASLWEKQKTSTDIYVKAESLKGLKILEIFYEKDISLLKFNKIVNGLSFPLTMHVANPKEVVNKYNSLK